MPAVPASSSFWPLSFAARSVRPLHPACWTSGLYWCCDIAATIVLMPAEAAERRRPSVSVTTNLAATCGCVKQAGKRMRRWGMGRHVTGWRPSGKAAAELRCARAASRPKRGVRGEAALGVYNSELGRGGGAHDARVGDLHLQRGALERLLPHSRVLRAISARVHQQAPGTHGACARAGRATAAVEALLEEASREKWARTMCRAICRNVASASTDLGGGRFVVTCVICQTREGLKCHVCAAGKGSCLQRPATMGTVLSSRRGAGQSGPTRLHVLRRLVALPLCTLLREQLRNARLHPLASDLIVLPSLFGEATGCSERAHRPDR